MSITHKLLGCLVISISLSLISISLSAQKISKEDKLKTKADVDFYEKNYQDALKNYQKVYEINPKDYYSSEKIAYCYLYLNMTKEAIEWFANTEKLYDNFVPDFAVRYALALMEAGEYELAREKFQEYNDFFESDNPLVYKYLLSIENKDRYFSDSIYFSLMNTILSSKQANFSPQYYNGDLIYINTTAYNAGVAPFFKNTELKAASVDEESINETGLVRASRTYSNKILSLSIAEKANEVYATYVRTSSDPMRLYNLVAGEILENRKFGTLAPVKIEGFNLNILHVTVDDNAKTIYFASDAPGGYGGFDIYKATRKGKVFSNVTNLGERFNTSEDELFPYLFNDTIIYFASKGHGGVGGFDIFISNLKDKNTPVANMGYPINTNSDEFTLSFYSDYKGFISSNREDGKGLEDIYQFTISKLQYKGIVTDENTGQSLKEVDVSVSFDDGKNEQLMLADNGMLVFEVTPGSEFDIRVSKDGYEDREFHVDSKEWNLAGTYSYNAGTLPMKPIPVDSIIYEPLADNVTEKDLVTTVITPGEDLPDEIEEEPIDEEPVVEVIEVETIKEPEKDKESKDKNWHYEVPNHGITFRVQIAASRNPISEATLKRKYTGDLTIDKLYNEKWYKYSIGAFTSYYKANDLRLNSGVRDAFVSAYKDGSRLRLMDAIEMAHVPKQDDSEKVINNKDDYVDKSTIYFGLNNVTFSDQDMITIYKYIDLLNTNKDYYIELIGYSDKQGSAVYNKAISYQRAVNIQQLFIVEGINPERVETYGYGEVQGSGITAQKRRVEIILKSKNTDTL